MPSPPVQLLLGPSIKFTTMQSATRHAEHAHPMATPEDWKALERHVSRIEKLLAPYGATVTWNDRIPDKITGRLRQIDVSIKYTVGTVPVLIVMECRRHRHKQDSPWLESLATKARDVGAAKAVAISTSGFTEEAVLKAKHHNIDLRTIREIDQTAIPDWLIIKELRHTLHNCTIHSALIVVVGTPGEPADVVLSNAMAEFNANNDAALFNRVSDGAALNVGQLLDAALRLAASRGEQPFAGAPHGTSRFCMTFILDYEPGLFTVPAHDGPRTLKRLTLGVHVDAKIVVTPVSDIGFVYEGPDTQQVFGVEATTTATGEPMTLSIVRQIGSQELRLMVTRRPNHGAKPRPRKRKH